MSFESFSKNRFRHDGARFSRAMFLSASLLAGACVASKPLDGDPRCPCAPGWSCAADTQTCVEGPNLERGGHDGGGAPGSGGGGVSGGGTSGGTGSGGVAPAGGSGGAGGGGGASGCGPLVVSPPMVPIVAAPSCPCTRRPGPGNSYLCPMGANATVTQSIGPAGGLIYVLGQQSKMSNVPFAVQIPPGALTETVMVTVTETNLDPPADFVDYSPVFHVEPDTLALFKIAPMQVPWSSNPIVDDFPPEFGVYWNPAATTCGFTRVADSYTNAGFENASFVRSGYYFVGSPKTATQPMCIAGSGTGGGGRGGSGAVSGG